MKVELLNDIEQLEKELMNVLSSFSQDHFNIVPFEGSWTAGQVLRHILLSASSLKIIYEPVKDSNRSPGEHIDGLRGIFLDFGTKMHSPEFIVPEKREYNKDSMQNEFIRVAAELKEIINTLDLSKICINTPPVLGELTRLELISFIIFHTQRHTNQLKTIRQALEFSQNSQKTPDPSANLY